MEKIVPKPQDCYIIDTHLLIHAFSNFAQSLFESYDHTCKDLEKKAPNLLPSPNIDRDLREMYHRAKEYPPTGNLKFVHFGQDFRSYWEKGFKRRIETERKAKCLLYYCMAGYANCRVSDFQYSKLSAKAPFSVQYLKNFVMPLSNTFTEDNSKNTGLFNKCKDVVPSYDSDKEDCEVLSRTQCNTVVTIDNGFLKMCEDPEIRKFGVRCITLDRALKEIERRAGITESCLHSGSRRPYRRDFVRLYF